MYEIVEKPTVVEGMVTTFQIDYRFIGKNIGVWYDVIIEVEDCGGEFSVDVFWADNKYYKNKVWYFDDEISAIKKARRLVKSIKSQIEGWGD